MSNYYKENKKKILINDVIENKINKNNLLYNDESEIIDYSSDEYSNKLENYNKELSNKSITTKPKNYGNLWNDKERNKIIKYLLKNKFDTNCELFNESTIYTISKKLERTEYAVKEELKKMIYNQYLAEFNYEKISKKFNMPVNNIKLIIKLYVDKNAKKIINQIEDENKILKLRIENIKLKKELDKLYDL